MNSPAEALHCQCHGMVARCIGPVVHFRPHTTSAITVILHLPLCFSQRQLRPNRAFQRQEKSEYL